MINKFSNRHSRKLKLQRLCLCSLIINRAFTDSILLRGKVDYTCIYLVYIVCIDIVCMYCIQVRERERERLVFALRFRYLQVHIYVFCYIILTTRTKRMPCVAMRYDVIYISYL